jgi:hypothetical protein
MIARDPRNAGGVWGYVSTINSNGQTIFVVDAHRGDEKRFVVRADEKLTAFLELESAISKAGKLAALHGLGVSVISELAFLSRDYRPNKNKLSCGYRSRASNTVEGL